MGRFKLNLHELGENVALKPFRLTQKIASGSKEGQRIIDIIENDSQWIIWCMENIRGWFLDNDAYYFLTTGILPKCTNCTEYICINENDVVVSLYENEIYCYKQGKLTGSTHTPPW